MNISGIQSLNMPTNNNAQSKQKNADKPFASLASNDSVRFSGILFSKENREETGKTVAKIHNTAEAGAKVAGTTTAVTAGAGLGAAAVPVVGLNYLLGGAQRKSNESLIHEMTPQEREEYRSDADYNQGIGWCP